MNEFPFAKTEKAQGFCCRVSNALETFCNKSATESVDLIRKYWSDCIDLESDEYLYHESPYYYAMCIAHHPVLGDNNANWHLDSSLWPPPPGWDKS